MNCTALSFTSFRTLLYVQGVKEAAEFLEFPGKTTSRDRLGKWDRAWIIQEVGNFMGVPRIIQIVGILAWGDALGENSGSGIAGNSGVPGISGTCGISGKIVSGPGWKNGIVPGSLSGSWEFWLFSRITQVCKSRLGEMPWGKIQDLELLEILEFLELLEFLENQKTDWNLPADAQLQKNSDPQLKK